MAASFEAGGLEVALLEGRHDLAIVADRGCQLGRAHGEVQAQQRLQRDGHGAFRHVLHVGGFTRAVGELYGCPSVDGVAGLVFVRPGILVVGIDVPRKAEEL